jgi:hypothetical protein
MKNSFQGLVLFQTKEMNGNMSFLGTRQSNLAMKQFSTIKISEKIKERLLMQPNLAEMCLPSFPLEEVKV